MKNSIIRCKCVDMSVEGFGIAKADSLVIFVKGLIKDEEADVKIISEKKNYAIGIIDKLIVKSEYRRESECPISYKCGGCDYRYIDYDYQLKLKKEVLENTFKDLNVDILDVIKDDNPFYYRNKVQIPVKDHKFGFYREHSNDIVEFDECYLETKISNEIISNLKPLLLELRIDKYFRHILIKHAFGTDEIMIGLIVNTFDIPRLDKVKGMLINKYPNIKSIILNLNTRDDNVILGDQEEVIYGQSYITDIYDGIKVNLSLKSFYQVNYNQMIKLYKKIEEFANINENSNVLDLYCGIGTISLFLARKAKKVIGIEIVEDAIKNAKENALLNNMNNVEFYVDDARKGMDKYLDDIDVLIVDPPRKGLSEELINNIKEKRVKKIVYVSCNPATLNRDLNMMSENYNISDIQPVDMFPFTTHVESIVVLSYKKVD